MIVFEPNWVLVLQLLVAVVLPVLVGLVTKVTTAPGRKAVLLLLLSLVAGVLGDVTNALTSGTNIDLFTTLLYWIGTFVIGVALHYGLLKPGGVSDWAAETGRTAKHVGQ